jgi:hypothetical protein
MFIEVTCRGGVFVFVFFLHVCTCRRLPPTPTCGLCQSALGLHTWSLAGRPSAVQCSAVQCSAVQCSAVQCSAVQCSAVQCSEGKCLSNEDLLALGKAEGPFACQVSTFYTP